MVYLPIDADIFPIQLSFALSRRFGPAVKRNRARRRMRAAFGEALGHEHSELEPGLKSHTHCDQLTHSAFLLSANRSVLNRAFPELVGDMVGCFKDLYRRQPERFSALAQGNV